MKPKLIQLLKVILCCFIIVFASCENDKENLPLENQAVSQESKIIEAEKWFKVFEAQDSNYVLFQNIQYDWSQASVAKSEDGTETIIVPIVELKKNKNETWEQKLYIYKLGADNYKALLFEFYPNKDTQSIDGGDFNGYISAYDLKIGIVRAAKFVDNKVVENGVVKEEKESNSLTKKRLPLEPKPEPDGNKTSGGDDPPIKLSNVVIFTKNSNSGSNYSLSFVSYGGYGGYSYGSNTATYTNYGGGGGTGIGSNTAITEMLTIEDRIDDSKLNPCLKGIMDKLKDAKNVDIVAVLAKLGANGVYNLTMKMGTVRPENTAETIRISKNNYQTTFSQDSYTDASTLYMATNLIHETIHAYLLSVVDDYKTYPTNAPFTDFPQLFKIYVEGSVPVDKSVIAHHEDMANRYVDAISSALFEYYASEYGVALALQKKQAFTDMAWSGLQNTDVFNKKFPPGSVDAERIIGRIITEQTSASRKGQTLVGIPCK